jgi:CRISPR-associated protein Cmr2
LWFGSYMLSEVSKAVAKFLHDSGAVLIFPAPEEEGLLAPDSELLVANHILAEVPESTEPAVLAKGARDAAQERWLEFAGTALKAAGESAVRKDIWEEQIKDIIEFYAAWMPLNIEAGNGGNGGQGENYPETRERLEKILAGRKALRDFYQARGRAGIPKSSLDGARESVLSLALRNSPDLRRKIKVKRQEQLDSVGLVKRCAVLPSEADQEAEFVSVVRVAADPWIRRMLATPKGKQCLEEISKHCQQDFAPRVKAKAYRDFPYDGTPLYLSRLAVLKKDEDLEPYRDALTQIEDILKAFDRTDQPSPYFAVLIADGDRMGATLSAIKSTEAHRNFSKQLSRFAREARDIIEEHHGCLVYSGGDDVLAFIPVDQCLYAARKLHDIFSQKMENATQYLDNCHTPTLSVGIAIGHCFEPLEYLLRTAREAEHAAKTGLKGDRSDERDGFAVYFVIRGSDAIRLRDRWGNRPDERLKRWIDLLLSNKLSDRVVYDLHYLAGNYKTGWNDVESIQEVITKEAERVLRKKRVGGQKLSKDVIRLLLEGINRPDDLERVARELLVARHMAQVYGKGGDSK